jgi:Domain of unknown function (DUF4129)
MASSQSLEIRPRTTGEILDDAWRLYFADAPRLLLLHGLFHVPAFSVVLILVASQPSSFFLKLLLPFAAALLLSLTGLGSAAVQERFRRLAEGRDATLRECVGAALRRGLEHAAVRAVLLVLFFLVLPGLLVWPVAATLPIVFADNKGLMASLSRIGQEARFDAGKASAVVFCRLPLLFMAFVNAHLLVQAAVWVAGNLAGFDVALLGFQLSLANPVYDLALLLAVWLLLAPFFEASNYLLYLDTRTRQEGLDLLYRVQRAFSAADPKRAAVVLAVVSGWLLGAALPIWAAPPIDRAATVRMVRQDVEQMRGEVKDADPYQNGAALERRLAALGGKLEKAWDGEEVRFPWYRMTVEGFKNKTQRDALLALDELQRRLALLEETLTEANNGAPSRSKDDIKKLLRQRNEELPPETKKKKQEDMPDHIEVKKDKVHPEGPVKVAPSGGGLDVSLPSAGLGNVCWFVFAGLMLAVIVAGLVLFWVNRPKRQQAAPVETGRSDAVTEQTVEQLHQHPVADLLRRADALAEQGRPLEALRAAYLVVLSLLHRRQLLRYEPTRTNGEYVREVRLAAHAPAALHEPFNELTKFFEVKWYGQRACEAPEYREARALVERIQNIVGTR